MLGTLDFRGSEHRVPINFSLGTFLALLLLSLLLSLYNTVIRRVILESTRFTGRYPCIMEVDTSSTCLSVTELCVCVRESSKNMLFPVTDVVLFCL